MAVEPDGAVVEPALEAREDSAREQLHQVRRNQRTRRRAAALTLVLALVTIVSALSPPLRGRLEVLLGFLPFIALHTAATTTVFAGFALVALARGLRSGHRLAWAGTVGLLSVSVILQLVKGLDVEEGMLSAGLATWLVFRRRAFTVTPTAAQARWALTAAAGAATAAVLIATALVFFFGRHGHPHMGETVRAAAERLGGDSQLPLVGLGPTATPLLAAVGLAVLIGGLGLLMSPRWVRSRTSAQHRADRERARVLVQHHGGRTLDYFALRDDKDWFFTGDAVVPYAVRGGVCLVSPDPIGPAGHRYQTWADFMDFTARRGWSVAVVGAAADWLPIYEHTGLRTSYLGDEAVVDVVSFSLAGRAMKGLRQAVNRVERAGVTVEFIDPATAQADVRDRVLAISGLSRHGATERGFSMTLSRLFDPADTGLLLVVASDASGRVLGFIQWVPATALPGWSLDVMRRDTAADIPNGVIDFLIVRTIEHIAARGARGLALNFAVLRETMMRPADGPAGRVTHHVLDVIARHSQLDSLAKFNEKYNPAWVPRYVVRGMGAELLGQGMAVASAEGLIDVRDLGSRR